MTLKKINIEYEILISLLKKEKHGRELSKELDVSLTNIQTSLSNLKELNIVDYRVEGKNHIYFIKTNLKSKSMILNSENYKLIKLLTKHPKLEPVFEDILKKSRNLIIVLFGSYAKGTETKDSDIDIFVNTQNTKLKKEIEDVYQKINVKIGTITPNNPLINEIKKNHIIISGGEPFYEELGIFSEIKRRG